MIVITPPNRFQTNSLFDGYFAKTRIFLAGSIEMGKAEDWQSDMIECLRNHPRQDEFIILNPRRKDWDPGWEQSMENPKFVQQVEWELSALEASDLRIFYFQPGTLSPISMMELGLHLNSGRAMVCCPDGFHRKANIDITCRYYGVPVYDSKRDFCRAVQDALR